MRERVGDGLVTTRLSWIIYSLKHQICMYFEVLESKSSSFNFQRQKPHIYFFPRTVYDVAKLLACTVCNVFSPVYPTYWYFPGHLQLQSAYIAGLWHFRGPKWRYILMHILVENEMKKYAVYQSLDCIVLPNRLG